MLACSFDLSQEPSSPFPFFKKVIGDNIIPKKLHGLRELCKSPEPFSSEPRPQTSWNWLRSNWRPGSPKPRREIIMKEKTSAESPLLQQMSSKEVFKLLLCSIIASFLFLKTTSGLRNCPFLLLQSLLWFSGFLKTPPTFSSS